MKGSIINKKYRKNDRLHWHISNGNAVLNR